METVVPMPVSWRADGVAREPIRMCVISAAMVQKKDRKGAMMGTLPAVMAVPVPVLWRADGPVRVRLPFAHQVAGMASSQEARNVMTIIL